MTDAEHRWIPAMRDIYSRRLARYEKQVEQRYPGLLDRITEAMPVIEAASPPWCPLPIGAVIALGVPVGDASAVTAVYAWRAAGRHVTYIHPDRVPPPVDRVPVEEIKQVPVRCVYMATSDADGVPASGFFAWLEWDQGEDRTEVRMQVDLAQPPSLWETLADPVHVVRGSLRDAVAATQTLALMRGSEILGRPMPPVGKGTEIDPLIDRKTTDQAWLLASIAFLAAAEVVDASVIVGGGEPQQWEHPSAEGQGTTLWLAA